MAIDPDAELKRLGLQSYQHLMIAIYIAFISIIFIGQGAERETANPMRWLAIVGFALLFTSLWFFWSSFDKDDKQKKIRKNYSVLRIQFLMNQAKVRSASL